MLPRDRPAPKAQRKNLLQVQRELLRKALGTAEGAPSWKILVFDTYTRGIVSAHMKMKDLRDHNITLYLSISETREQIHGVTILYLVQPTIENVTQIAEDLMSDLYTSIHIHFSSQPSPSILSTLAKKISQSKRSSLVSRIQKIEYSCIGYFSIDSSMAILPSESQIVNLITALSLNPIFVYNPRNEQSAQLVEKLKTKMQMPNGESQNSPLSVNTNNYATIYLFNRENDNFPLLAHGITYGSLLENMYRISKLGNRVHYEGKKSKEEESGELSLQDDIWLQKKNYLISEMGLEKESNRVKSKLLNKTSEDYSELTEKSAKIEWHVNNAGELIMEAKARRLIEFYDIEKEIYSKSLLSKDSLKDALNLLKEAPNAQDKIRLMLIYVGFIDNLDEMPQLEAAFPDIKKVGKYNELKEKRLKGVVEQSAPNKYLKKFAKGIWKNLVADDKKFMIVKELEKVRNADFSELIEAGLAVETLEPLPKNLRVTRNIVHCLGGACFHEYANLMENDPDCIYTGDKIVSFRDVI